MCSSALARSELHLLSLVLTQHRFLHRWLWTSYSGSIGGDTYTRNSLTIAIMRKHTVKLHGHHCQISVHREGRHTWFAVGDYDPRPICRRCREGTRESGVIANVEPLDRAIFGSVADSQ